jgi:RNA polymerase sigma-70 factor, ECF subfamily
MSRPRDFEALYDEAYAELLRFAQRRTDREHAEDVVAEAFLVVWRRLDELPRDRADARAWLFGIARRVLLNANRGAERRRALGVQLADAAALAPPAADDVAARVDLGRAWRRLSDVHQEALALLVFEGLDSARAATVLGISPVAFRLRVSRARRALRVHLDQPPRSAAEGSIRDAARQ